MKMKYFIAFIAVLYAVSGEKEDFDNLEELMDNPDLLMELEKRLGALLSEDGPKSIQEKEAEVELFCNATTGTLSLGESSCDFHTSEEMIIRTTDSLEEGADFLGKIGNILCAKDCTEHCCNDSRCDTAVYQDKDDHKCYLFRCGVPSVCVFDTHASFRVSSVSRAVHKSHSFVPGGNPVSHENELENLEPHVKKPEPGVTKAPTTTTESLLTTTTNPALGEACNFYGAKCADPHAECYMRECSCRAGFHQKHGVCRRHCREEEFECDNEGYGPDARQCVHSSYHCDGNRDCVDGSDERYCHKVDEGYKDVQNPNIYQKQLFQYPYNNVYDGLNNQQPVLGVPAPPAKQNYLDPVQANGIPGGQYYIPGFTNQNQGLNIPQTGSQVNNWPFIDNSGAAQSAYQNSVPYQNKQQQNNGLNQGPNMPVVQHPNNQIQQAPVQAQPVSHDASKNIVSNNPSPQVSANKQPVPVPPRVNEVPHNISPTEISKIIKPMPDRNAEDVGNIGQVVAQEKGQDQKLMNHPAGYYPEKQYHVPNKANSDYIDETNNDIDQAGNQRARPDSRYDYYDSQKDNEASVNSQEISPKKATQYDSIRGDEAGYTDESSHRHSEEEISDRGRIRTYPPSTKAKSQIEKPTQSTVPGQKSGHGSAYASERIEDFPIWMQYESESPNINAKKGKHLSAEDVPKESEIKSHQNAKPKSSSAPKFRPSNTKESKTTYKEGRTDSEDLTDDRNYQYNRYGQDDTHDFGNDNFPSRSRDRHRGYDFDPYRDRYGGRYHKPNQDSRYPYYDSTGYRGHDRYHYPVWDSLREEYYYPDSYENRKGGNSHGVDYEDYRTDNHPGPMTSKQDTAYKPKEHVDTVDHVDKPTIVAESPMKELGATDEGNKAAPSVDKGIPSSTTTGVPSPKSPSGTITTPAPSNHKSSEAENHPPDVASKNVNSSDSDESEDRDEFAFFSSVNTEQVESYTDASQGPIVALALGLAITLILLIFVGCRLRNVKRRLRKGRALHSNEADYLINGMYL